VVGYDERGFVVQNSWGTAWRASGFAVLPYDDWIRAGSAADVAGFAFG
jgi:C1A family cysteine protease